jgi:ATP-dependent DNA helicase RecQ
MAALRPASLAAMAEVPGVGAAKLERYGAAFLEVIRSEAFSEATS